MEGVYLWILKLFPLLLEFQVIYLTLYHTTSLKMVGRLEEVRFTLLFPAPASVARHTASNPAWQSCFGCPCVNVIVEQFGFFSISSLLGSCICIMYQLQGDPKGAGNRAGDTRVSVWWVFPADCLYCSRQVFEFCVWLVWVSTDIKSSVGVRLKGCA